MKSRGLSNGLLRLKCKDNERLTEYILCSETAELLQLKNEYFKPRDLGVGDTLERIVSGVLNQEAMAMDTAYVDDVNLIIHSIIIEWKVIIVLFV